MTTIPKKRRPAYVPTTVQQSIEDLLGEYPDLVDLHDEMEDWASNMEGTSLSNTTKCEQVREAADTLEKANELEEQIGALKEALERVDGDPPGRTLGLEITYVYLKPRSKRKLPSRATRLENALGAITKAVEHLESYSEGLRTEASGLLEASPNMVDDWATHRLEDLDELDSAIEEVKSSLEELSGVEFPGMYG